jgi:hypothetical protein
VPYKSDAQRRWMYWAEKHGKVPKGTAARWQAETPKKDLPERVQRRQHAAKRLLRKRHGR